MSEEQTAPAPVETPDAAPLGDAQPSVSERIRSALTRRRGDAVDLEASAPAPDPEPVPTPDPEPEVNPLEVELDKTRSDVARFKAAARDTERRYRQLEGELKELRESLDAREKAWREDPYKAVQEYGGSIREWADKVADGSEALTPEQQKLRALEQKLTEREQADAKAREEAAQREAEQAVEREIRAIDERIEQDSERFGLIQATGLQQAVRNRWYELREETGENPDLSAVMEDITAQAAAGLRELVTSEAGRRALLADESVVAALREAIGGAAANGSTDDDVSESEQAQQASTRANGGRIGAPALTQDTATRSAGRAPRGERSEEQRRAGARRAVRRMQERLRAQS